MAQRKAHPEAGIQPVESPMDGTSAEGQSGHETTDSDLDISQPLHVVGQDSPEQTGATVFYRQSTHVTAVAITLIVAIGSLVPSSLRAASPPDRTVITDRQIGVSLMLPAGWQKLSRAKDGPLGMTLAKIASPGQRPQARMSIEVLGTMRIGAPPAIARSFACGLSRGYAGLHVQRSRVYYAGTTGVMLHGMPGARPTVQIVLARHGLVYHVVAFGRSLASDHRAALAGLTFISVTRSSPALTMAPRVKPCDR